MKFGVVCEGETDFIAIKHYVGAALSAKGIDPQFVLLQPAPDNSSRGGWSNVMEWLVNNPPESRQFYFEGGLFAGAVEKANINSILVHLDTDIVSDQSFFNYLKGRGYEFAPVDGVLNKAQEISRVLLCFLRVDELGEGSIQKYLPAPIAESSEAWCIAVDDNFLGNPENLCGQELIDAFGAALARFDGREVNVNYSRINKKTSTRERYCSGTAGNYEKLDSCLLFRSLVNSIVGC